MKSVYCTNLGCGENKLDGLLINNYLENNDWQLTDNPQDADLLVVNSCGFTEEHEQHSIETYHKLDSVKRAGARVIFAGCLPAINKQAVHDAGYRDVVITPRTLHRLDAVTEAQISIDPGDRSGIIPASGDSIEAFTDDRNRRMIDMIKRAVEFLRVIPHLPIPRWLWQFLYFPSKDVEYIRIGVGCRNRCTFCAIPLAKGRTKSVPENLIVDKVRDALRRGKRYIALSCDELGSYGQDIDTDIVSLLGHITDIDEDFRLILRNAHPEWMIKYWQGLERVFATGKIGFITLPLQSGSDRILHSMDRNHTADEYLDLVHKMRKAAPRLIIRTHILLGYPGETKSDFRKTYDFVKQLPIDLFYAHAYSERSVTLSAKIADKVSDEVAKKRVNVIKRLNYLLFFRGFRWFPMRP